MPLKLKRLNINDAIGVVKDPRGNVLGTVFPDPGFVKAYNDNLDRIEAETGSLEAAAAATAAAASANAAAATANSAASAAATATAADARFLSISNSTVTTASPPLLQATDAGANTTITVAANTRHYADGTSASVLGGTVTGLGYSTQYFIFYDQASLAGGAVTYAASTSGPVAQTTASGGANPNRHFVGSVVTPAALGAPVTGTGAVGVTFDQPIGGNWI